MVKELKRKKYLLYINHKKEKKNHMHTILIKTSFILSFITSTLLEPCVVFVKISFLIKNCYKCIMIYPNQCQKTHEGIIN